MTTRSTRIFVLASLALLPALDARAGDIRVGVATLDVTPTEPVWLSGYASRNKASVAIDNRLHVKALAISSSEGKEGVTVLVSLDNCEVTREYTAPALREIESRHRLARESVIIVSSHTHSAPVLHGTLPGMYALDEVEQGRVSRYSEMLRERIVDVVGAALADMAPARLFRGSGRATFAMNRRVFRDGKAVFGENRDGPVDLEVPVLKVTGPGEDDGDAPRAILFGYACHGTSIGGSAGEDFYAVSGDYMSYARDHLEKIFPGSQALYLTGLGADINPSPRGKLQYSKQHGLELAGAVASALTRPMREIRGSVARVTKRIRLELEAPPTREALEADAKAENRYVRIRARLYLDALDTGSPRPAYVDYPISVLRVGDDLTMVLLAGEVVVDYALRLKRELAWENPWLVGYASEVPCYIPNRRILLEGGYEADYSLVYYGIYGPFKDGIEEAIVGTAKKIVSSMEATQ